jgi:hypothetical protein
LHYSTKALILCQEAFLIASLIESAESANYESQGQSACSSRRIARGYVLLMFWSAVGAP